MAGERPDKNGNSTNQFGFAEIGEDHGARTREHDGAGARAENGGTAPSAEPSSAPREQPAGRSAFERRVREGADAFEFGTLISGAGPASGPAVEVEEVVSPPHAPADSDGRAIVYAPAASAPARAVGGHDGGPAAGVRPARRKQAGGPILLGALCVAVGLVAYRVGANATEHAAAVAAGGAALPDIAATAKAAESRKGLPNPALTPGDYAPGGNRDERVPAQARTAALHAYHIPPGDTRYVVIRLIPLAFDGTNRPANLFPTTPWFADLKARLDKKLEELVHQGKMTTAEARQELTSDWIRSAHKHYVRNYGLDSENAARQEEQSLHWY